MKSKPAFLLLTIILMISGCTTVAQHTPLTGAAGGVKLGVYRILVVRPFTTAEGLAAFEEHVEKIRQALLLFLMGETMFQEVSPEDAPAEAADVLVLDAKLTRAKSVSSFARAMFGILPGRAGAETEVTLTDRASGMQVAKEMIVVQSDLRGGVYSGTDRDIINAMAHEIVNFLKGLR
jgi:hypothetical protein